MGVKEELEREHGIERIWSMLKEGEFKGGEQAKRAFFAEKKREQGVNADSAGEPGVLISL